MRVRVRDHDAALYLWRFAIIAVHCCFVVVSFLVRGRGIERATGAVFAAWAAMNAVGFLAGIVPKMPELPSLLSVTVQPLGRALAGEWLLRESKDRAHQSA